LKNKLGAGGRQFHSSPPGAKLPSYATAKKHNKTRRTMTLKQRQSLAVSKHMSGSIILWMDDCTNLSGWGLEIIHAAEVLWTAII